MKKSVFFKHRIENLIVIDKIVTVHYFEFGKDFVFEGEAHDFWELVYADKAGVICSREGEEVALRQGDVLFHRPNEFHTIKADGVNPPNVFVISFVCRSSAMGFFERRLFAASKKARALIAQVISEAKATFDVPAFDPALKKLELLRAPSLGGQQMLRTYLEQFLITLMREYTEGANTPESFLLPSEFDGQLERAIVEELKRNVFGRVSLDTLCGKFHYGKTFLCNKFRERTGETVMKYYMRLKIAEAKKLLRQGDNTCAAIADMLGFDSPPHFTRTFKAHTGMTPVQFCRSASALLPERQVGVDKPTDRA